MLTIERINKGPWGKIMAFFDLRTSDGLVVKGFKLIEGSKGPFVGMPSQKGKDNQYYDTVFAEAEVKADVLDMALESFGIQQEPPSDQVPPEESPPGDDDIPF